MTVVTNQSIFLLNQELLTLLATEPALRASFDCFNVSERKFAPVGSYGSPPSPSSPRNCFVDGTAVAYPSLAHFRQLSAALRAAFPDFDFSTVSQTDFKPVQCQEQARSNIYWALQNYVADCTRLLGMMWTVLDKEAGLQTCSIYRYDPDRPDAFSVSGVVTTLNYFFLNDKTNRIVLVHLREGGIEIDGRSDDDEIGIDENYDIF